MDTALTFHTIGHSIRSFEVLTEMVEDEAAWPLIDIRSYPGSRRYPHFNKEHLSLRLGRKYVHLPLLGGRRSVKTSDLDNGAWINDSFRYYANYMNTDPFRHGLRELLDLGKGTLMCSEAVWWRCHRRMVSDALVLEGHTVIHVGVGKPGEHTLCEFAATEPELHYPNRQLSLA